MMKRILKILFVALLVSLLAVPFSSQRRRKSLSQYWRGNTYATGFILYSSPQYSGVDGKGASRAVSIRSDRHSDVYFIFPAVSGKPYVRQASYYLLARSGAYSGNANLNLEVYDFNVHYSEHYLLRR
jgi:hypothetical protein